MKSRAKMALAQEEGRFKKMFLGSGRERGFFQALIPLASAGLSAYSAYQSGKKKPAEVRPEMIDTRNPERRQIDSFLANYVSKYGPMYEPGKAYGGKRTAGMSSFEGQGLEQFLTQYLNAPDVSGELGDVRGLLNKTVKGGFDPGTSEYYQALRDEAGYNRKAAVDDTNADLGARGKFFSSEAVSKYGDINAQMRIGLNKNMAELADRERARSLSAVPQAAALEDFIAGIPLNKAKAATSIGSLPRLLEQADLEALYQDFERRQKEGAAVIGAGTGVSSARVEEGYRLPNLQAPQSGNSNEFLYKMIAQYGPQLLSMIGGG